MSRNAKLGMVGLALLAGTVVLGVACAPRQTPDGAGAGEPYLTGAGTKIPVGSDHYIVYGFDRTPKLGPMILKVEVYDRAQRKVTPFEILAEADMPAMSGAHATGPRRFSVSRKGDYLIPLDLVMPGEWIITLWIGQDGREVFTGAIRVVI